MCVEGQVVGVGKGGVCVEGQVVGLYIKAGAWVEHDKRPFGVNTVTRPTRARRFLHA